MWLTIWGVVAYNLDEVQVHMYLRYLPYQIYAMVTSLTCQKILYIVVVHTEMNYMYHWQ